jgi:hypothetical protein
VAQGIRKFQMDTRRGESFAEAMVGRMVMHHNDELDPRAAAGFITKRWGLFHLPYSGFTHKKTDREGGRL